MGFAPLEGSLGDIVLLWFLGDIVVVDGVVVAGYGDLLHLL